MKSRFVVIASIVVTLAFAASSGQSAFAQMISPADNSLLTAGNNELISWVVKDDTSSIVVLQYSTDDGFTWAFIASSGIAAGSYNWVIPVGINSSNCRLKIVKYTDHGYVSIAEAQHFAIMSVDPNSGVSAVFSHRVITITDKKKNHLHRFQILR